jgi:hypothetical protein
MSSSRGRIKLYNADENYNSLNKTNSYYSLSPKNNNSYSFWVYPLKIGGRSIDGHFIIYFDQTQILDKPSFRFTGNTYDFLRALKHSIPELGVLNVNINKNKVPASVLRILSQECGKFGINLISDKGLDFSLKPIKEEVEKENLTVSDLGKAVEDMSMRSKMQDPYHRGKGLSAKIQKIMKIALHIIKTPIDEMKAEDDKWSIVPDKPSEDGELESIKKFKTRDQAANWLKKHEKEKEVLSEDKSKSPIANIMTDWFTPEEASKIAWGLRKRHKIEEDQEI